MKIIFFDTHSFEKEAFEKANSSFSFEINFVNTPLDEQTASLAHGHSVVCSFVNDKLNANVLKTLKNQNVKLIALRSAGYNHVDLTAARELGLHVVRVPEYSPHAIAEFTLALLLTLTRKTHRAYNRIKEGNYSLDGLVGFDLYQKRVGIVGTGRIGTCLAEILLGFGCQVLAYDKIENAQLEKKGVRYLSLDKLLAESQIISLNVPLTPETHHLINESSLALTQKGFILVNTGRGGLVCTKALISSLKSGHIGGAALDVYEEEAGIFFQDHTFDILQDDVLARLTTFPNVLLTSHQAFLTHEALENIAYTTLQSIHDFSQGYPLRCEV